MTAMVVSIASDPLDSQRKFWPSALVDNKGEANLGSKNYEHILLEHQQVNGIRK
jgi:hypothetical protein